MPSHPLEKPVVSATDAVAEIPSGSTIAIGGSGSGHCIPDALLAALGQRFRETRTPEQISLLHPFGVGDQDKRGLQHMAFPEMYTRVIGGHWSMQPAMAELARQDAFPAYCLPAGVIVQMLHCAAAGSPGFLTPIGLDTFVDPRREGGKLNDKARAAGDVVRLIPGGTGFGSSEQLYYPTVPVDVALIAADVADPRGNLGQQGDAGFWHNCAMAQAAKAAGGRTIAVVRRLVGDGEIDPRHVRVPGCFVDAVVVDPEMGMTYQTRHEPAYNGDGRRPESEFGPFPLSIRKVIARRAAEELFPGAVINVGFGMPDGVLRVAREEGHADQIVPTIEHGQFGGIPADGFDFGATWNPEAIVETGHMFDFYQGRGVDVCFLGFLQIDRSGNVNVSQLGDRIIGVGGFIDISQPARTVVFCGTLSVKADARIAGRQLQYQRHGKPKLVEEVAQVTFSANRARETGQRVLYVTEAGVFALGAEGIELIETAPGVVPERDIFPQMAFAPPVRPELDVFPAHYFED